MLDRDDPVPAAGELLVAVTAVPITPLDLLCATGTSYFGAPALPYVPGVQAVGVVRAGAPELLGRRVWFPTTAGMAPGDGGMAELAVATSAEAVVVEADLPDTAVAALGLSAVAAWEVLQGRAALRPGETVLVLGAGGVVGQVAVQAARLLGAGRVVAAARSVAALERATATGADAVVDLRDGEPVAALAERLRDACGGSADVVVDPLAGIPGTAAALVLAARRAAGQPRQRRRAGRLGRLGHPAQQVGRGAGLHEHRAHRHPPPRGVPHRARARRRRPARGHPRRRAARRRTGRVGRVSDGTASRRVVLTP